jgi:hypothetical protein
MYIFRWIELQDARNGVLVDLFYKFVDGDEYILDLQVRNIINNVVGEILEGLDPMIKVVFSANILRYLDQEKNKEK